jgi:hypothetical protein
VAISFFAAMSAFAKASTPQRGGNHSMRFSVDAEPPHAAPHRSVSLNWLQEVLGDVPADHSSDVRPFLARVAEVEAG